MGIDALFYWNHKGPGANLWRPRPGANPIEHRLNIPLFVKRMDLEATVVDAAPFVATAGAAAHISQIHAFGFTASASVFRNVKTLSAIHRATVIVAPIVLACQAMNVEYRNMIPRWAHERELHRDEEIVRQHVNVGMSLGAVGWVGRTIAGIGRRYWSPIEVLAGGALADLLQREYLRAHGF